MKQLFFVLVFSSAFAGCNTETGSGTAKTDTTTAKEAIVYPFTPRYSMKWQPGDEKNALTVLNCLKHYVDGDMKGAVADFADSVEFLANKFSFKGSKDSLAAILGAIRADYSSVSKVFETWITTYYPDKDDTWVTLWYTETWTDKKGKTDSLSYVDDVLIKNGKIVLYDEKQRAFPDGKPAI